jgi:RNA polymerase sigma-70 factor (ECF subfamily)
MDAECNSLDTLLTLVGVGDQSAFARLYDATSPLILGLLVGLIHDRSTAEGAMIDVFCQVWRSAPDFDPTRMSAPPWILTIALRHAAACVRDA